MTMSVREDIDRAVLTLRPIDLAEMDSVSLMNRVDTKYAMRDALLAELLTSLADSYRVLEVVGVRKSPYSSLYFDTPTRACYYEHHNGHACRRKFRMRSYTASNLTFFEIKQRTNKGRTVKKRVMIPGITTLLAPEATALVEKVAGSAVALSPQIYTEFSRITLVGVDFTERVTIDVDLDFHRDQQHAALPGIAIVEVKQARASRNSVIRQRLRDLQVRPMRVSKYCVGSALLDPTLKRNRFKSKLMTLQSDAACLPIADVRPDSLLRAV
jgi:hypothetical protein